MTRTTRRPGVTLMEVLIATAILSVGMMAIMALFPIGAVNFARALNQDRAATHGVNSDEFFRYYWKKSWVELDPNTGAPTGSICPSNEAAYYNSQEPMLLLLENHPTYGAINPGNLFRYITQRKVWNPTGGMTEWLYVKKGL